MYNMIILKKKLKNNQVCTFFYLEISFVFWLLIKVGKGPIS